LARPHSKAIAGDAFIPLFQLTSFTSPPSDRVETFYDESERFVRFLASTDKPTFLTFVDALARHQPFDAAFARIYAGKFVDKADMEQKFRESATADLDISLQQAGN
jgi:hypothetical protein